MQNKEMKDIIADVSKKETVKQPEAEAVRRGLEAMTNSYSFKPVIAAQELYLDAEDGKSRNFAGELARAWVIYWATGKNLWIDKRNRRSVEICRQIMDTAAAENLCSEAPDPGCMRIMEEIGGQTHRTLVQSISALMFLILAAVYPKLGIEMTERYGDCWYRSPMI